MQTEQRGRPRPSFLHAASFMNLPVVSTPMSTRRVLELIQRAIEMGPYAPTAHRTSAIDLFTFAGHLVVPVHERTVRVVPPSPDVQFEMCRQTVPVRAVHELERLSLEYRRTAVTRQPGGRDDNELYAHQLQTAIRRFVY